MRHHHHCACHCDRLSLADRYTGHQTALCRPLYTYVFVFVSCIYSAGSLAWGLRRISKQHQNLPIGRRSCSGTACNFLGNHWSTYISQRLMLPRQHLSAFPPTSTAHILAKFRPTCAASPQPSDLPPPVDNSTWYTASIPGRRRHPVPDASLEALSHCFPQAVLPGSSCSCLPTLIPHFNTTLLFQVPCSPSSPSSISLVEFHQVPWSLAEHYPPNVI
jgi:hypothetical protein